MGKGGVVRNGLVGGGDDKDWIFAGFCCLERRQGKRCCRIAANRLQQQRGGNRFQLAKLIQRQKTMIFIGNHQGLANLDVIRYQAVDTFNRLLKQAIDAREHEKLFRKSGAGQRPKAGA
ncbi:MAG: hypothetical protein A2Z65_13100 [Gallionellales bacterium RIFCSPLOWO2_02_58_13]|nr:MAG: hypothetical protein A2Z65_13100 [Gallionellales bacterium RIFCSPLOWO2_02_58_13]